MSEHKEDKVSELETNLVQNARESLIKWREARLKALQKIEAMVNAAHGKAPSDDGEENTGMSKDHSSHLRECLKELADLYLRPHPNYKVGK